MYREHIHENRHAHTRLGAKVQLGWRHCGADKGNLAIGGTDDQIIVHWRHALGITIEIDAPDGQHHTDPEQRVPEPAQNERNHEKARDKRIAFPMDRHESIADSVSKAHRSSFEFGRYLPHPIRNQNPFRKLFTAVRARDRALIYRATPRTDYSAAGTPRVTTPSSSLCRTWRRRSSASSASRWRAHMEA